MSLMLGGVYVGIFGYFQVRRDRAAINEGSQASDPGLIHLSYAKLKQMSPQLFPSLMHPFRLLRWLVGPSMAEVYWIQDVLIHGDSRAAVVASLDPLLVAAYTDELDCIAMLKFPARYAEEYNLSIGSRLLTVLNCRQGTNLARDLQEGPASYRRCTNFIPFIAEFLSDDIDRIEARKKHISDWEWQRTWELANNYLQTHGAVARDGRPPKSGIAPMISWNS